MTAWEIVTAVAVGWTVVCTALAVVYGIRWVNDRLLNRAWRIADETEREYRDFRRAFEGSGHYVGRCIIVPGNRSMNYMRALMAARDRTDVRPIEFDDLDDLTGKL